MEGFVKSEVLGAEDEIAREGTALAKFIGAANYWQAEAERKDSALLRVRVRNAVRLSSLLVAFFAGVAAGGALHLVGLW
jgi:hypothetical protein